MGCGGSTAPVTPPPAPPVVAPSPSVSTTSVSAPVAALPPAAPEGFGNLNVQVPIGAKVGAVLQLKTPQGTTIQCQVPPNVAPGGIFQVQYPLAKRGPSLINEVEHLDSRQAVAVTLLPSYWTNVKIPGNTAFDQMVYVDRAQHPAFQEIFNETYFAKATRDRACPKPMGSTCPLTAGGCPCVQPGGNPGLPTGYVVRRIVRVEDSDMWARYVEHRAKVMEKRQGEIEAGQMPHLDPPATTDVVADKHSQVFEALDNDLNEIYLWHGTSVRSALSIAQNDFKVDLAGNNVGTMYGQGCYLAESCTKADEYAAHEPGGYYNEVFALLLCRVCLGKYYYTEKRDENAGDNVKNGNFDSTVGDRKKAAGTFREFVIYDSDAIYPEYVVVYSRIHKADPPERINDWTAHLFHMQVPVYWSNCHRNPAKETFHDQYIVRPHTQKLLQSLLEACYSGKVIIKEARRIENSTIWQKYISYKLGLNQSLQRAGSFKAPHELDGDDSSGHTLTHLHLEGGEAEESISTTNLDARLNESLLWHGTSKRAAQKIVEEDFYIPVGKEMKHAARFGNGAYLSETLDKCLIYADTTKSGTKVVLLCRVLCGDFYYTEAHTQIDAGQKREQQGKHTVLANPEAKGPREFIVPNPAQVYPEFMLEIEVPDWVQPPPQTLALTTMEIQVPAGVAPGSTIRVRAPDGREVDVLLPPDATPGCKIRMQV